jgi:mono/diheme cytochrome c family protein
MARILTALIGLLALHVAAGALFAQEADPGRRAFESRCARCHGADANGGEMGPPIALRLPALDDQQLATLIHEGRPAKGMPPSVIPGTETAALVKFLRTVQRVERPVERRTVETTAGGRLEGVVRGEGFDDLQLETADGRVHLLRHPAGRYIVLTSLR